MTIQLRDGTVTEDPRFDSIDAYDERNKDWQAHGWLPVLQPM